MTTIINTIGRLTKDIELKTSDGAVTKLEKPIEQQPIFEFSCKDKQYEG